MNPWSSSAETSNPKWFPATTKSSGIVTTRRVAVVGGVTVIGMSNSVGRVPLLTWRR
jgi:hypothetical protein